MKRGVWALCLAAMLAALPAIAPEMHGESDIFAAHGVALAWAIARGPDEARTFVVVRVMTHPSIRALTVKGRDPFTKSSRTWLDAQPMAGQRDVRIPRAAFADFPHTEWQFLAADGEPRLTVSYHGVPDTTPEFADAAKMDAYLEHRVRNAE